MLRPAGTTFHPEATSVVINRPHWRRAPPNRFHGRPFASAHHSSEPGPHANDPRKRLASTPKRASTWAQLRNYQFTHNTLNQEQRPALGSFAHNTTARFHQQRQPLPTLAAYSLSKRALTETQRRTKPQTRPRQTKTRTTQKLKQQLNNQAGTTGKCPEPVTVAK